MPSALLTIMQDAAFKASKGLLRDFGEVDKLQISRKGTSNFVTSADKKAESIIMKELSSKRPDYSFLGEETGSTQGKNKEFCWIIDPIDGTHNFIHAIPYFCISIALERRSAAGAREVVAGVVYDPIHQAMYTAEKGKGAMLNDMAIRVSRRVSMDDAMVVVTSPRHSEKTAHSLDMLSKMVATKASCRYMGALALDLANLAAGRFDVVCLQSQYAWDVAAGALLVQEAGGLVTKLDGSEYSPHTDNLLATNKILHPAVMNSIKS